MDDYILYLINEMRVASAAGPACPPDVVEFYSWQVAGKIIKAAEKFAHGDTLPLSTMVGIPYHMLPDPRQLTDEHLSALLPEMFALLDAFRCYPEYPGKVPDRLLYKVLRSIWDDEFTFVTDGIEILDLCDFDDENCPFEGYCNQCEEILMCELNDENDPDELLNPSGLSPANHMMNENHILDGVQNYCDRWCERCPFRGSCYVAITEETMNGLFEKYPDGNIPAGEMENWPDDEEKEDVQEIDFDAEWTDEEIDFEMEEDDFFSPPNKARRHPLTHLSKAFAMQLHQWLKNRHQELGDNLTPHLAQGYSETMTRAEEVLSRFHFFIPVKLQRALVGLYDDDNFLDDAASDMNGTAKVALLCMDETLEAITLLLRSLKNHRSELKDLRQQLENIRYQTETEFPEARAFIRPYHDQ